MHFIDEAKIYVKAGAGGNGAVAFRREAHVPNGGPSGGDGGNGGDVVFVADEQLSTLLDFKYQQHYRAGSGEHGRGKDQYGKAAAHLVLRVPVGTLIKDRDTGNVIADLTTPGQRIVLCHGGKGGLGNIHFKSAWNQAPRQSVPGTPGEERTVVLVLKLLADAGLVGFPNAGKSTVIAAVSAARPKIADYPFTTLTPNLGVVGLSDHRHFVLADIPGLIEGASEGAGLGLRFLRHIERTKVLIFLLDVSLDPDRGPERDYDVLLRELERYEPTMLTRPRIVALNKIDLTHAAEAFPALKERFLSRGIELFGVSAATHVGLGPLLERAWAILRPSVGTKSTSAVTP